MLILLGMYDPAKSATTYSLSGLSNTSWQLDTNRKSLNLALQLEQYNHTCLSKFV